MALGEKLCNARLARKESLSDVAAATRMKVQVVEAIEKEDFRRIAAPIYAKGFIRLYAEHVGLDPRPLIEEYASRFAHPAAGRRPSRLQDGQPRVAKILQHSADAEGEPPQQGGEPPVEADLFDRAPPAPDRGAPPVPRFEKEAEPAAASAHLSLAATLRQAAASVASAAGRAAGRLRSLGSIQPVAADLFASPAARIAVGVASVLIVALAVSALSRCSASHQTPEGQQGSALTSEPIELAVEPPAAYVD